MRCFKVTHSLILRAGLFAIVASVIYLEPSFLYLWLCKQYLAILVLLILVCIAESIYFSSADKSFWEVLFSKWLLFRVSVIVLPLLLGVFSRITLGSQIEDLNFSQLIDSHNGSGRHSDFSESHYRIEGCCIPLDVWLRINQGSTAHVGDAFGKVFTSRYGDVVATLRDADNVRLTAFLNMNPLLFPSNETNSHTRSLGKTYDPHPYRLDEARYFHRILIRKVITGIRFHAAPLSNREFTDRASTNRALTDGSLLDPASKGLPSEIAPGGSRSKNTNIQIKHSFGFSGPLSTYVTKLSGS